ncbi:hypothetical protein Aperf_G00000100554 [Anoplocephala perfoliata]
MHILLVDKVKLSVKIPDLQVTRSAILQNKRRLPPVKSYVKRTYVKRDYNLSRELMHSRIAYLLFGRSGLHQHYLIETAADVWIWKMLADNIRPEYYRSKHRPLPSGFAISGKHDIEIHSFNNSLNGLSYLTEFSRKITIPSGEMIAESSAFSQSLIGRPFFSMGSATDTLLLGSPESPTPAVPDFETATASETERVTETATVTEATTKSKSKKKKRSKGAVKSPQTDSKPESASKSLASGSTEFVINAQGEEPEASKSKRRRKRRKKNKAQQPEEKNVSMSIEEEELKGELKEEEEEEEEEKNKVETTEDFPLTEKSVTEPSEFEPSKEAETKEETDPVLLKLKEKYGGNYAYEVVSEEEGEFREVVAKRRNRGARMKQPKSPTGQEVRGDQNRPAEAPPLTAGPSKSSGRVPSLIHASASSSQIDSSKIAPARSRKEPGPSNVSVPLATSASQMPVASKESHSSTLSSKPSAWSKALYRQPASSSQVEPKISEQPVPAEISKPIPGQQPHLSVYSSTSKASEQPSRGGSVGHPQMKTYDSSKPPLLPTSAVSNESRQATRGEPSKPNGSEAPKPTSLQISDSSKQLPSTPADSSRLAALPKSLLPTPSVPPLKASSAASTYGKPEPSIYVSSEVTVQSTKNPGQPTRFFTRSDPKPVPGIIILDDSDLPGPFKSGGLKGRGRRRRRQPGPSLQASTPAAQPSGRPQMPAASGDSCPVEPLSPIQSGSSESQSQSKFPASRKKPYSLPHPYVPGGELEGYACEMTNVPQNLWVPPELSRQLVSLDKYMRSEWEEFQRMRERAGKKFK